MPAIASTLLSLALVATPDDAWQAGLEQWRQARAESLQREDGWLALVGLHWLEPGMTYRFGSAPGNDIVVDSLPALLGRFTFDNGVWSLQLEPGMGVQHHDGVPEIGRVTLLSDRAAARAGVVPTRLHHGSAQWMLIVRAGRTGLRIWDAQSPARTGFRGLKWFGPDPSWRIEGRWVAHEPPRTMEIATVLNTVEPMHNPGAVHFERDGKSFVLEALAEPGDDQLFIIFADRSNRTETYGAGRYLYADRPDAEGHVVLDFNRAYNPPCAFTPWATCPLPPPENRLDLYVTAGERRY